MKQRKTVGKIKTSYNFPIPDEISVDSMMSHVEDIYEDSQFAFKLNISLGIILQQTETGSFRYFVPYHNETLFSVPIYVRNRRDLDRIRARLSQLDITEYCRRQRPETRWKPVLLTNIQYEIYNTSYPLGSGEKMPGYIMKSKSIITFYVILLLNATMRTISVFFRCLAFHKTR